MLLFRFQLLQNFRLCIMMEGISFYSHTVYETFTKAMNHKFTTDVLKKKGASN